MIELLKLLLSLSLSGTLVIIVLFLCRPLYRKKLSRQWQYYIWLVAVARLLLPFSPEASLSGKLFQAAERAVVQSAPEGQAAADGLLSSDMDYREGKEPNRNQNENQTGAKSGAGEEPGEEHGEAPEHGPLRRTGTNLWFVFGFIWLTAAVALRIRKITVYQSFVKYIRAGRGEVDDMKMWEHLGRLTEQAGIRTAVGLYTNSLISSPLLIGFFHPCIMLPSAHMSDSDFENTVLHELTHFKRRDMFYKWLIQVTVCIHWFNPFVYLMGAAVNRDCEFSCDEAVIRRLDRQARRIYGDTLLSIAGTGGTYSDSLASVTLSENAKLLKERLDAIMDFRKKTKLTVCISIILSVLLLCGSAFAGAYRGTGADGTADTENGASAHGFADTDSLSSKSRSDAQASSQSGRAPDHLQTKTARAAHVTGKERPDMDIIIENDAAVRLVATADKEVTVDYGDTLYDVSVENENGNWKIYISYAAAYSKYTSAVLHIPDIAYGNVNIQVGEATLDFDRVFRYGGTIHARVEDSASIFYSIPSGFQGTLDLTAPDCYLELTSDDGYKNCDIAISNCATFGDIADGFTKQGGQLLYFDGTGAGVIRADLGNGGYASIESGRNQPSDSRDGLPESQNQYPLYSPDSSGKLVIPVSIGTIDENSAVCIGEIPDIQNAVSFDYDIQCAGSDGIVSAGLRRPSLDSEWFFWYQRSISADDNRLQTHFDNDITAGLGIYESYAGSYRFYIQNKGGTLSNLSGTVTVQYAADTPSGN